jgi:hypothetical protein
MTAATSRRPRPPDLRSAAASTVGTFVETLIVVLRCTVFFIPYCAEKEWGLSIREWLAAPPAPSS